MSPAGSTNATPKMKFDNSKHIITGVVCLADTPIYRYNERMGEYYVVFTKETIEKVWHNWQVSIDKAGMHVKNVFTNENHDFKLTDKQLNGEESLVFKLGNKQSINRFYLLTNMLTYTL